MARCKKKLLLSGLFCPLVEYRIYYPAAPHHLIIYIQALTTALKRPWLTWLCSAKPLVKTMLKKNMVLGVCKPKNHPKNRRIGESERGGWMRLQGLDPRIRWFEIQGSILGIKPSFCLIQTIPLVGFNEPNEPNDPSSQFPNTRPMGLLAIDLPIHAPPCQPLQLIGVYGIHGESGNVT